MQIQSARRSRLAPTPVHELVGRQGRALADGVRRPMERLLGADLGSVRIHDDALAARATAWVDAIALASGEHVAFAPGAFAPATPRGRYLLAHELAHVIQQRRGPVDGAPRPDGLRIGGDRDRHERAADALAARAFREGSCARSDAATMAPAPPASDSGAAATAPAPPASDGGAVGLAHAPAVAVAGPDPGLPVQTFRLGRALARPFTWPYNRIRGLATRSGRESAAKLSAAEERAEAERSAAKLVERLDRHHEAREPYMELFEARQEALFDSWGPQEGWSEEQWDEYDWNAELRRHFSVALYNSSEAPEVLLARAAAAWRRRAAAS